MADIVELILADHGLIRRLLAELDATWQRADGTGPGPALPYLWQTLAALLEAHLGTAEEIGFLALFDQAATTERNSARGTHDDIREALGEARLHPAGSPLWRLAVLAARAGALEHIHDLESGPLARFQRDVSPQIRETLGRQWLAFAAALDADQDFMPGRGSPQRR